MHPAAVLKHSEPFVSILQDIHRTFISPAKLGSEQHRAVDSQCSVLVVQLRALSTRNMFKVGDNSRY